MSAAAPVAVAAAPAAGAGAAAVAEEKTEFTVVLAAVGEKINVIKEIRAIANLGLKEAKDPGGPQDGQGGVNKDEAAKLKKQLEDAGRQGRGQVRRPAIGPELTRRPSGGCGWHPPGCSRRRRPLSEERPVPGSRGRRSCRLGASRRCQFEDDEQRWRSHSRSQAHSQALRAHFRGRPDAPNLIEVQKNSYDQFLQKDEDLSGAQPGLPGSIQSRSSPIRDFSERAQLEFLKYGSRSRSATSRSASSTA